MRSVRSLALARLILPLLLGSASGCASGKDAGDNQLAKLKEQVLHLQSETDRLGERLDAMESQQATPRRNAERSTSAPGTVSRPRLKVVHVEPDAEASADDVTEPEAAPPEADTGPRLLIQGEGKTIETKTMPAAPVAAKTTKPENTKASKSEGAKATKPDASTK